MHHCSFPFYVGSLFHKTFIVVTLIILLGDAGNPKSLRGRKGKLHYSRLLYLFNEKSFGKDQMNVNFITHSSKSIDVILYHLKNELGIWQKIIERLRYLHKLDIKLKKIMFTMRNNGSGYKKSTTIYLHS